MGSVIQWDAKIHKSVFRDLVTTVPNKAYIVRDLWALFNDESLLRNMILKRLDKEIREVTMDLVYPHMSMLW